MSSGGVPNPISSAYDDFLGRFREAAEDSNCTVWVPSRPIRNSFFPLPDNTGAEFKTSLYVKKLPARRLAGNKRLDVAIQALETLKKPTWSLTKSIVYLNYFVVSDAGVQLVQSMHYDFVQGGQTGHPIFHLHLDTKTLEFEDLREMGVDVEQLHLPEAANECWLTTRIPTADMTFPSVLYCLAGDHLPGGIFSQFSERSRAIQERMPALEFQPLKESLRTSAHFKSSHWFAHMFQMRN